MIVATALATRFIVVVDFLGIALAIVFTGMTATHLILWGALRMGMMVTRRIQ